MRLKIFNVLRQQLMGFSVQKIEKSSNRTRYHNTKIPDKTLIATL